MDCTLTAKYSWLTEKKETHPAEKTPLPRCADLAPFKAAPSKARKMEVEKTETAGLGWMFSEPDLLQRV